MGNIGVTEILLIVFIIVLFFGGKKIPGIAKAIGDGIREIRKSVKTGGSDEVQDSQKNDKGSRP